MIVVTEQRGERSTDEILVEVTMNISRNDPCPCGSGLKYKQCCLNLRARPQWMAIVVGSLFALLLGAGLVAAIVDTFSEREDGSRRVWSEEHKHWHTEQAGTPGAPPPGPPPPGKAWSTEHGHWHDADTGVPGAPPPDAAPEGKTWSTEHGHWHDAE